MGPVADYRLRHSGLEANGDIAVSTRHLTRSVLPGDAIWLIVSKPEITAQRHFPRRINSRLRDSQWVMVVAQSEAMNSHWRVHTWWPPAEPCVHIRLHAKNVRLAGTSPQSAPKRFAGHCCMTSVWFWLSNKVAELVSRLKLCLCACRCEPKSNLLSLSLDLSQCLQYLIALDSFDTNGRNVKAKASSSNVPILSCLCTGDPWITSLCRHHSITRGPTSLELSH